jgi:RNA polymerase sigma factor (sigma-70 family)
MDASAEPVSDDELASWVHAAAAGDAGAWESLVDRFGGLVWSIARAHRLSEADAADVSQTAWLRLVEHLGRIRQPERVGAWLAATARNECLRVLRLSGRQVLTGDELEAVDDNARPPGAELLRAERDTALWRAFGTLTPRCQALLRVLVADPAPSYEELASALGMPIGSLGPTRARCLERLRRHPDIAGILAGRIDSET